MCCLILSGPENFGLYFWTNKIEKWQFRGHSVFSAFFASCGHLTFVFEETFFFLLFRISSFEDGHQQHWRHEVEPRPPWKDCQPYPKGNSCFGGVATTFHRQIVGNHKNGCIFKHVLVLISLLHQRQSKQQTHSHTWQGIPLKTKSLMLLFRKLGTR